PTPLLAVFLGPARSFRTGIRPVPQTCQDLLDKNACRRVVRRTFVDQADDSLVRTADLGFELSQWITGGRGPAKQFRDSCLRRIRLGAELSPRFLSDVPCTDHLAHRLDGLGNGINVALAHGARNPPPSDGLRLL